MSDAAASAVRLERASATEEGRPLFRDVSFEVSPGVVLALTGQRAAARAILQCLDGRRRVSAGRVAVLGLDPASRWRLRGVRRRLGAKEPLEPPAGTAPKLLLLEEPPIPAPEFRTWLRKGAAEGMTACVATGNADVVAALADRAALFSRGRLIAEGPIPAVVARFRRIRFVNRITETRGAFGTELDEFEAVRVRVRGWGIEAVVSNFDERALERLRLTDGVSEVEAGTMNLGEILEACAEGD